MSTEAFRDVVAERKDQYGPRGVIGETPDQRADDLRRDLILRYAIHPANKGKPGPEGKPGNMWEDIVDDILTRFGNTSNLLGNDTGTSSGYLPELLLEKGYQGGLLACDVEAAHLPRVADRLYHRYQSANVWLGRADAESGLRSVRLLHGDRLKIADDTFDFSTVLNIFHHAEDHEGILRAIARVTKPDGLAYFMGRARGHLDNMYKLSEIVAEKFEASPAEPFYNESNDMFAIREMLEASPDYRIVKSDYQAEYLWIDNTEEGRRRYLNTFYAFLPLMRRADGRRLRRKQVEPYVNSIIIDHFKNHGSYEFGGRYLTEYIFQEYFACEVVK